MVTKLSEDLSSFLVEQGVPTAYLHSGVKPMQRLELLRQLRSGEIDVIVGVNLLREARIYSGATVELTVSVSLPEDARLVAAAKSDISIQLLQCGRSETLFSCVLVSLHGITITRKGR